MRVSVEPAHLVRAVNFYDFIFGFGAFATPMVLGGVLRKMGYGKGLAFLAAVSVVPVVMGVFAEMNPSPGPAAAPAGESQGGLSALLSNRTFWVVGLAFLFYVPLESSVAGWATTIVAGPTPDDRGRRVASVSLSGFWLGFMGSRLLVAIVGAKGAEQAMLASLSLISVVLMLGIVFVAERGGAGRMVVLSGLAFGPIFPTMMAILLSSVAPETMGRAVGFFFFFGSVGWTVIPILIGAVARKRGIQKGFLVAAASGAVFVVFILVRGALMS
jgi:fucose permease